MASIISSVTITFVTEAIGTGLFSSFWKRMRPLSASISSALRTGKSPTSAAGISSSYQ